jgi:hypothetical protein
VGHLRFSKEKDVKPASYAVSLSPGASFARQYRYSICHRDSICQIGEVRASNFLLSAWRGRASEVFEQLLPIMSFLYQQELLGTILKLYTTIEFVPSLGNTFDFRGFTAIPHKNKVDRSRTKAWCFSWQVMFLNLFLLNGI